MDNGDDTESEGRPLLSTGQLAAATGVSSRTIRYYEELGILPPPPRTAGGTRRYPTEYRFYVEGALALKEIGFNLDEIRVIGRLALGGPLSAREREDAHDILRRKGRVLERRIRVLNLLRDVLSQSDAPPAGYSDVIEAARDLA
ncbi:MAG: MerR family transcriptional regulator [Acidimicrobiia bacterium]|nr:MerR family transcriptional regulator [Acidimicrobiia bacterium]